MFPTGVDRFGQLHPQLDGRGVVIAILDSGLDPSVAGLDSTTDGHRKVMDIRDFSGEGSIALAPASLRGDTIEYRGRALLGASRVRGLSALPPFGGLVIEPYYGNGAGADLNADGAVDDTLLVVVAKGTDAWFMMADTDGNGSLADESPIRDYSLDHRWFGWSQPRGDGPHIGVVANISDSAGLPRLSLVFDSDGHGTHVAGIAAGHDLFGIAGFDGAAPGARVLGLKVADDADGGITTTGSLVKAVSWAIDWSHERGLPLVINLSFGVGNQGDGSPRIDVILDSILDRHPDVVMTVSAGNDGPGLNTIGFPATARNTLAVGATLPLVFAGHRPDDPVPDPVAHFSSRGGRFPGPDLVAPGTAWSIVPRFDAGHEEKSGTSMAAPHIAGLAARLVGQLAASDRVVSRHLVTQALRATARPVPFTTVLDVGAGIADIGAASAWLKANRVAPVVLVARPENGTVWALEDKAASSTTVTLMRLDSPEPLEIRLRSDLPWLGISSDTVATIGPAGTTVQLVTRLPENAPPEVRIGSLIVESGKDEGLGVLLRVPITIRQPVTVGDREGFIMAMQAGQTSHGVFVADSGRAIRIAVNTLSRDGLVLVALDEPAGQPARSHPRMTAGSGEDLSVINVDGRDVVPGLYSITLVAPPTRGVAARVRISESPVFLGARRIEGHLLVAATNLTPRPVTVSLGAQLIGAEGRFGIEGERAVERRVPLAIPDWATQLELDTQMDPNLWQSFTDVGVSLRDRDGSLLIASPLTHAFGRLYYPLPSRLRGDTVYVEVSPAATTAEPTTAWQVAMVARFLLPGPRMLGGALSQPFTLVPGERRTRHFDPLADRVVSGAGLRPLLRVIARDAESRDWTSTIAPLAEEGESQ